MDDLISRDDAIRELNGACSSWEDDAKVAEIINALPSADAVQGEWIFRTDIPIGGGRESSGYVCSNCRKDYFHVDGMNFCPNCGAKMTKGGDNE